MNNIKYLNSNNNFIGLLAGFGGYTLFVLLDSIIKKYLVTNYSVFQINFFICFFSFIPTCLFLHFYSGWSVLINNTIHIQLLRGVFGVVGGAFVVNSFIHHSFSEIYPILFSAPLILCVMSFFFLKEKVGYNRWAAVLIGFVGVLIVSRPGTIHFTLSLLGLFVSAFLMSVSVILIRKYGNNQSSIAFTFYGFLSATIINALLCSKNYNPLMQFDIYIFIFCGVIIGMAGLFISVSARTLESSIFAPIQYSQLIAGLILGYLFFRDLPDLFEIIGSIIIILSGIFIIYIDTQSGIRPFTSKVSRVRDMFNRGH